MDRYAVALRGAPDGGRPLSNGRVEVFLGMVIGAAGQESGGSEDREQTPQHPDPRQSCSTGIGAYLCAAGMGSATCLLFALA